MTERERLLEQAADLEEQGYEAFKSGDASRSRALNEESLALARQAADPEATGRALAGLMRLGLRERDFDEVERLAAEGDEIARLAGDPALRRMPIHMRAEAARMQGDLSRARDLYDASIGLNRDLGHQAMVAAELGNKAWLEIASGRLEEAERLFRASLASTDDGERYAVAFCLLGLARVELERGHARGGEILGAAEAVLEHAGLVWDPAEEPEYEATLRRARATLGAQLDERRQAGATEDPRSF